MRATEHAENTGQILPLDGSKHSTTPSTGKAAKTIYEVATLVLTAANEINQANPMVVRNHVKVQVKSTHFNYFYFI